MNMGNGGTVSKSSHHEKGQRDRPFDERELKLDITK